MNGRQHKKMFLRIREEQGPNGLKAFFAKARSKGSKKLRRRYRAILRVLRHVRARETPEQRAERLEQEQQTAKVRAAYKACIALVRAAEAKYGPITIDVTNYVPAKTWDKKEQGVS